ncbi:MAG: hypothetical protein ABGX16_11355 [Pirellulales bacterium]
MEPRHIYDALDGNQDLFGSNMAIANCAQNVETVAVIINHGDPRYAFALHRDDPKNRKNYDSFKFASLPSVGQVKYDDLGMQGI